MTSEGFSPTGQMNNSGQASLEIQDSGLLCAASIVKRPPPVNLQPDDQWLFEGEFERKLPETVLRKLHSVGISPEGILFKGGKILIESFAFPHNFKQWKRRSVVKFVLENYLLKKKRQESRPVLWVVDDWGTGYFHWLTDVLPRLAVLGDQVKNLLLLLPAAYERLPFVLPSLGIFDQLNWEFMGADEVVNCEMLVIPGHTAPSGHYRPDLINSVGKRLVEKYGAGGKEDKKLYVSRARARYRRVANEDQVVAALREYGFAIIDAEDHSFEDQIKMASQARYFVSNHGAGLTNMLFMQSGSSVLELRHRSDNINNCYFTLASALGHNYSYQLCEPLVSSEDPHTSNLVVDIPSLRRSLDLLLAS